MKNAFVHRYTQNTAGRDFAVGDIHGMFRLLQIELDNMGFDASRDRLFSVGDLVDRGPDSELCLEWISKPWFHAVQGNHEDMAIRYVNPGHRDAAHYAMNGGAWLIGKTPAEQAEFALELAALPYAIEVETADGMIGIVHADVAGETWAEMVDKFAAVTSNNKLKAVTNHCLWDRMRVTSEDQSGIPDVRAVIVGHTPLKRPAALGNVYHIDTGAVFREGYFTFIDLATLETIPAMPKKLEWEAA
ncbi:serine/threonine protein phosphatase 1 [Paraburkholderia fungorum]|uniref:Serine/threonine protein phosphatase 1 n=1 Tax=Paraburkholderia fungorum TaxID=134537 RepID=A0A1H1II80_9BURK|nr:metallophosphoesterase [Paraburkholderia fungorum]SDR37392.1 serine/threonine protein phosphatase 1 [Paraburkholderia fungorum]